MPDQGRSARPSPDQPLIQAVGAMLNVEVERLLKQEAAAVSDDPEGIHHMRVSARRLRGLLRILGPRLDRLWMRTVSDEVGWLAAELGVTRDLDVLHDALILHGNRLGRPLPAALEMELQGRRRAGRAGLKALFAGARYQRLRQTLTRAAQSPEVTGNPRRPAGPALRKRLDRAARALRASFRAIAVGYDQLSDAHLHEVRKRAKDLRYSAEAVAPWLGRVNGRRAQALAKRLARATDTLGLFQDQVTQPARLLALAANVHGTNLEWLESCMAGVGRQRGHTLNEISQHAGRWIRKSDLDWQED